MSTPPNRVHRYLLLVLAVLVFGLCLWRAGAAPIIEGLPFKDSDDIMRVLQVQRWLETGAWYELTQPRLNPPTGVDMHWSRLPDLPLAAVIWLSEPLLGADKAALLAAHLVPALLGVAFFAAFVWAARPFTGRAGLLFAGLVAIGLNVPLADFAAGRVDHHGWQLLLATLSAGALLRILALLGTPLGARDGTRFGAQQGTRLSVQLARRAPAPWLAPLAGIAGALGLWIGAEAIPPVAFGAALLALGWLRHGRRGAEQLARYGLALTLTTLALIPLALAPGARDSSACDAFSWVSVALAAAVALFGLGTIAAEHWLARGRPRHSRADQRVPSGHMNHSNVGPMGHLKHLGHAQARLLLAIPLGLLLLGLLYMLIPHCASGPYAGLAEPSAQLVARVSEAQPLLKGLRERPATASSFIVLPLLALLLSAWRSRVSSPRARTRWLGMTLLIAGGLLLMGWQLRGAALANLYAGLALTWWAAAVGARIGETRRLLPRLLRRAGPAVVVALLPLVVTLTVTKISDSSADSDNETCDLHAIAERLNQPPWHTQAPLLIAAPVNLGAPLLWLTPHQVLAAPYHRNNSGIEAGTQILFRDAETARKVIAQRGVDLLLVCPHDPVATYERRDGITLFYDQLLAGETPDWLVEIPHDGTARLLAP
ncbi:hypothetical protein [Halochromatium salexigens]|uniref:Uncharacterized protein n=1 Tax=Halochromatium salexigens TaxID=49447 RepID=A0AAJ0XE50_HALSE|nr:hypothetical protein [Halochromatium salexigens]MBK5929414.1 hypothetical protein [Halochromatium salexigens]